MYSGDQVKVQSKVRSTLPSAPTHFKLQARGASDFACNMSLCSVQVIVMSGHETIRVLEVGVDAQMPTDEESRGLEGAVAPGSQSGCPSGAGEPAGDAVPDNPDSSTEATGMRLPGTALPDCFLGCSLGGLKLQGLLVTIYTLLALRISFGLSG